MGDSELEAKVMALYAEGLKAKEIGERLGISWQTAAGFKAIQTIQESADANAADGADNTGITSLSGLEREMNRALRRNLDRLDPGFAIADEGKERIVERGRIDILARDASGRLVVIELKPDVAKDAVLAQVLDYTQALVDEGEGDPRAMIVALDFSPRLRSAARHAGVELVTYEVDFVFNRHFEVDPDLPEDVRPDLDDGVEPRAADAL